MVSSRFSQRPAPQQPPTGCRAGGGPFDPNLPIDGCPDIPSNLCNFQLELQPSFSHPTQLPAFTGVMERDAIERFRWTAPEGQQHQSVILLNWRFPTCRWQVFATLYENEIHVATFSTVLTDIEKNKLFYLEVYHLASATTGDFINFFATL